MYFTYQRLKVFIPVSLLILFTAFIFKSTAGQDVSAQEHIKRIENGLYPVFNIRGRERTVSIPAMMKEKGIAGLSMAFVDHGQIAWTKCYGFANLEDSIPMTPDHIMRAASLSKPVTAMAVLHLVEEGRIELDEDINDQLKGWKVPDNEFTRQKKVTPRLIISHNSGIANDVHKRTPPQEELPSAEDIFSGKAGYSPLNVIYEPGEGYKYSNLGYMLLAELISDVTGRNFEPVMDDVVFHPCGMKSSTFNQFLPDSLNRRIARGHDENGQAVNFYRHASTGAGALWTTPADLGLFLAEILNTYHSTEKGGKIISHELAQEVFEKAPGKLGFNRFYNNDHFVFRNDGSIPGFNCTLMGSVDKNQAVVIMLNTGSDEAYDFLNFLWRAVSMEYNWGFFEPEFYEMKKVEAKELEKYAGQYAGLYDGRRDSVSVTVEGDQLEINSTETGHRRMIPVGQHTFIEPEIPMRYYFAVDSGGVAEKLYIRNHTGDGRSPYNRID